MTDKKPSEASTGELLIELSETTSRLVRDEMRLARAELVQSARNAGIGAGLFGVAGFLALYGLGGLLITAGFALALVLPGWAAAGIVTLVVFAAAGVAAMLGRGKVKAVSGPEATVDNVKKDIQEIQEARSHDHA